MILATKLTLKVSDFWTRLTYTYVLYAVLTIVYILKMFIFSPTVFHENEVCTSRLHICIYPKYVSYHKVVKEKFAKVECSDESIKKMTAPGCG
jgi:uncharacterized membrane protein